MMPSTPTKVHAGEVVDFRQAAPRPEPVPFEHYDDISDEMIEKARAIANAPKEDDPDWKVVESVW